jgi:hypothetical protein
VSGTAPEDHWLDRLAVLQTRRQVLRTALAGAALTIPFARTRPARASGGSVKEGPQACTRGCEYVRQLRTADELGDCYKGQNRNFVVSTALFMFVSPLNAVLAAGTANIQGRFCVDQALLRQKAAHWDCLQPGCPGFDPRDKQYGPCASCDQVKGMCCPTPTVLSGYTCCICCDTKGNGCKAPPC